LAWAKANCQGREVRWYTEHHTGRQMKRPKWDVVLGDIKRGRINRLVIWRLDRLGRQVSGLCEVFEILQQYDTTLISLRDGIDLSTAAGRMLANVLASIAQFESELRSERVLAGQEVARANGKTWGGGQAGQRKLPQSKLSAISQLYEQGRGASSIAQALNISRPTVYSVLREKGLLT
jgi:DNA invertase Pin-like site-specific DNA recombinase